MGNTVKEIVDDVFVLIIVLSIIIPSLSKLLDQFTSWE